MRNITDERRVARGARIGKIATFAGLGLLIAGFAVSLAFQSSPLVWLSFACLFLGILVSSVGTANLNRWVREPRADQALAQGLKGYDDRYHLYNYILPAPHVLLSPVGLFVVTAMGQDGKIHFDGTKFHRDFNVMRLLRFMAEEGLGKPWAEAESQVAALRKLLEEHQLAEDVEIQNLIVFYSPKVELSVSESAHTIIQAKALKKTLRKMAGEKLPIGVYEQIQTIFDAQIA